MELANYVFIMAGIKINNIRLNLLRRRISTTYVVVFVAIILFILLYSGSGISSKCTNSFVENSFPVRSVEILNAQKKILFLRSLLKKHKVPEDEYNDEKYITIYIITPTYKRPEQKAELTRLKNVFLHVPALHWILVEDAEAPTDLVTNFLNASMLSYTHLHAHTPPDWKLKLNEPRWSKPRGVLQRNEGISWLRENFKSPESGVVYFADDDNTYSIELFEEMRGTNKVSVWPVGLVGKVLVERPKVNSKGKVVGWIVGWRSDRPFATDMAGFAINLELLINTPDAFYNQNSRIGFMESDFLGKLVLIQDLEPKANLCTKVLVWHTQTQEVKLKEEKILKQQGRRSTSTDIEI